MRRPLSLILLAWWLIVSAVPPLWSIVHPTSPDPNTAAAAQSLARQFPTLDGTDLPFGLGRIIAKLTPFVLLLAGALLLRGGPWGRRIYVVWRGLVAALAVLAAVQTGSTVLMLLGVASALFYLLGVAVLSRPAASAWLLAAPAARAHPGLSTRRAIGAATLAAAAMFLCLGLGVLLLATVVHPGPWLVVLVPLAWLPFLVLLPVGLGLMPAGRSAVHAGVVLFCAALASGCAWLLFGLIMLRPRVRHVLPRRLHIDYPLLAHHAVAGGAILLMVALLSLLYLRRQPDMVF